MSPPSAWHALPVLLDHLNAALLRRTQGFIPRMHAEGTDAYRLFHGIAEGAPGVTVDRYGPLLLVQTFREPLIHAQVEALAEVVRGALGMPLGVVCNHRGAEVPDGFPLHTPDEAALAEVVASERGTRFFIRARHRGQDPWLFLDLRAGRARVAELAGGRSVLNLFAYTCGVGVVAARNGARSVLNVDFAESSLAVGERNAELNGVGENCRTLRSDCLPVLRQLAGQPVQRRGKHLSFVTVEKQPFDLVVLDPPRYAKGPFGTVDVVNDYGSLFKPALLTLAEGGMVLATNHVPSVTTAEWHASLRRTAEKAGRPLESLEVVEVEEDFPTYDGSSPLKMVLAKVSGTL